jgi:hypothetical protein
MSMIHYTIHSSMTRDEQIINKTGDEAVSLIKAFRQGWPNLVNFDGTLPTGFVEEAGITIHKVQY